MEHELPHEHVEHAEHAEHAASSGNAFLITVSGTIAVLAVLAAVIASLESVETASTIGAKNEAVLKQSQASDQWAFYQAKSLKQKMYEIAAVTPASGKAEEFGKEAQRYADESKDIMRDAKELEQQRDEKLSEADHHEVRHHGLTVSATMVHIAIAIATISIITRGQRWPWIASIILGVSGAGLALWTYLGPLTSTH
jgi:hypothetical protein